MTTPDLQKYLDLFCHRRDVYAQQQPDGAYFPVKAPLDLDVVAEHLAGFASYGTYVILPGENTVRYSVFDLDTELDDPEHHEAHWDFLRKSVESIVLHAAGGDVEALQCLLAEHSGRKGKHIWLFYAQPVPAAQARQFTQPVVDAMRVEFGLGIECFPKQDTVHEEGYGNLVKLPFGVHQVSQKKSFVIGCERWAESAYDVVPLDVALLPEVSTGALGGSGSTSYDHEWTATPFPCVTHIMREGVGQGVRERAMFHLALYLYGHGVDDDLAMEQCLRANENFNPPLKEREVRDRVKSAYTGRYKGANCGSDFLAAICPGPCRGGHTVGVQNLDQESLRFISEGQAVTVEVVAVDQSQGVRRVTVRHPSAQNTPTLVVTNN